MQTSTANEDIIEGVRLARDNTDFAVVISYTRLETEKIEISENYYEQKTIYYADIIEKIRGNFSNKTSLSFYAWSESGDSVGLPIQDKLIFLCKDQDNLFYFAGPGSSFIADPRYVYIAKQEKRELTGETTVQFCN